MDKTCIKKTIYKLLPKFGVLLLLIFAFDMLLNHLTMADARETIFEFDRVPIVNIEKDKKRQRWLTGYFDFEDQRREEKIPYEFELELNSKIEKLKLDIILNTSIVARAHIKEKGITLINIPFDNDVLRAGNRIQIRSSRVRWKLKKMSLVRRKRIRDGKIDTAFRLQNVDLEDCIAYKLEIKLRNTLAPLRLDVMLNRTRVKKARFNQPGRNKLVIPIDKKRMKQVNHLDIYSEHTGWSIERIDIIKEYGFFGGLFSVNLIQKENTASYRDWKDSFPSYEKFILLLLLWIMAVLGFVPPGEVCRENGEHSSKINKVEYMTAIVWGIIVTIPLFASLLTSYKMIYSVKTIILLLVIPILLVAYHKRSVLKRNKIVIPIIITAAFLVFTLNEVTMNLHQRNFSGLLRIDAAKIKESHKRILGIPTEELVMRERGYDGQLFYFVSFDPFLTKSNKPEILNGFITDPIYRYSRIGFPLLINMFSLGNKTIFPEVMLLLIIFSHLFASYFLLRILEFHNVNTFFIFLYLLIPGYTWSLSRALPESIAGGFLLAGFFYYLEKKPGLVIFSLASAVLVRETTLIFVITLILYHLIKFREIRTPLFSAAASVPFLFWRLFLTIRFFHIYGFSGFCHCPSNLTLPFYGFYKTYQALITGTYRSKILYAIGGIFPVILTLILILALGLVLREINVPNVTLLLYSLLSVALNYDKVWLHAGNSIRVTYEVFLFLILSFISRKTVKDRVIFYIIFFLVFASGFFYPSQLRLLSFGIIR